MNRKKLLGDTPFKSALSGSNLDTGRVNKHDSSINEYRPSDEVLEDIAPTSEGVTQGEKPLQNATSSGYRVLSNSAPKGSLCFKPLL